jgi:hypothetical protein
MNNVPIPRTPLGVVLTAAALGVVVWLIYASGLYALGALVGIFAAVAFIVYVILIRIYRLAVYGSIRPSSGGDS